MRCASQKIAFAMQCVFSGICALAAEIHCNVGRDAGITASAMRGGELSFQFHRERINGDVKGWFETAPCRATLATPYPALCPRILGTRFTNYGLRMFWGELRWFEKNDLRLFLAERLWTPHFQCCVQEFSEHGLQITVCESPVSEI